MDFVRADIMTETIKKEEKMTKKWKMQALANKPPRVTAPVAPYQSNQLNFLDQKLGLVKNPHDLSLQKGARDHNPKSMLTWGVSGEGEGKAAFLRANTKAGGPHERYGRQATSAMEIGWTSKMVTTHASSPFARRPLVQQDFYRPMGVSMSTGQLI
eukprot:TRINITY_DN8597_c0_g1_i1.p2 TRINITY_DN8597_c0_g1~~TRINITY_DN8597_c0_g1_i1.p2  ORF type:complete len:156 (+),score=31.50 TRINITY_DN8597_c0_g1_i1:174-641(+)